MKPIDCELTSAAIVPGLLTRQGARGQNWSWPALAVVFCLLLAGPPSADAARVTISALFGWNARVTASVWCAPNAPPALPNATGTALDFFDIPGAVRGHGAPLPPTCTPGTFANGRGASFWRDASASAALLGDSADGSPALLSMLTPVSYKSTSNLTVWGSVIDSFSAIFHVTYSSSDIGSGSLERWYDYETGDLLAGPLIQIGKSGSFDITIKDRSGWDHIVLDTEVASRSLPAPEPGTLAYLGSGLVGLSSLLRKRLRARS
jgi:hypothetical protein